MRLLRIALIGLTALLVVGCGSHRSDSVADVSKSQVQIYLVRHARAYRNEPNSAGMPPEKLDSLTPRGIAQADEAADSLLKKHVVVVYASPTHRTMQTAEIIAKKLHAQGPISTAAFG